jgi:hypothetical protein
LQLDEPEMLPPESALRMSNVTQHFSLSVQSEAAPHARARALQAAAAVHASEAAAASPLRLALAFTQHTSPALQCVPPQVSPVAEAPLEEPVAPEDDPVADPDEPPGDPDELEDPPFEPPPFSLASPPSGRGRTWPPHP